MNAEISTAFGAGVTRGGSPPAQRTELGQASVRPPVASCLRIRVQLPARPDAGGLAKVSVVTFWLRVTSNTLPSSRSRVRVPALTVGVVLVSEKSFSSG